MDIVRLKTDPAPMIFFGYEWLHERLTFRFRRREKRASIFVVAFEAIARVRYSLKHYLL
jgi:hypothetical protein